MSFSPTASVQHWDCAREIIPRPKDPLDKLFDDPLSPLSVGRVDYDPPCTHKRDTNEIGDPPMNSGADSFVPDDDDQLQKGLVSRLTAGSNGRINPGPYHHLWRPSSQGSVRKSVASLSIENRLTTAAFETRLSAPECQFCIIHVQHHDLPETIELSLELPLDESDPAFSGVEFGHSSFSRQLLVFLIGASIPDSDTSRGRK